MSQPDSHGKVIGSTVAGVVALPGIQQARDAPDVAEFFVEKTVLTAGQGQDDAVPGNFLDKLRIIIAPRFGAVASGHQEKMPYITGLDSGDHLVGHPENGVAGETDGKSTVMIGTTEPADYTLEKAGDTLLQLRLFHTRLPDYRERPLITTRFESAVDRVTPIQTAEMKGDSLFTIELREAVAYNIKQDGTELRINFAASSIPMICRHILFQVHQTDHADKLLLFISKRIKLFLQPWKKQALYGMKNIDESAHLITSRLLFCCWR